MKEKIHPRYEQVTITCMGCNAKIVTRSTRGRDFSVDVCSNCHPFYTGKQKYVDSAGRIERFQKKWGKTFSAAATTKAESKDEDKSADKGAVDTSAAS